MTEFVDVEKIRFQKGEAQTIGGYAWQVSEVLFNLSAADPSELALAPSSGFFNSLSGEQQKAALAYEGPDSHGSVEQPAPAKPSKFHDDISPQEWVKACRTVMTPKWMEY